MKPSAATCTCFLSIKVAEYVVETESLKPWALKLKAKSYRNLPTLKMVLLHKLLPRCHPTYQDYCIVSYSTGLFLFCFLCFLFLLCFVLFCFCFSFSFCFVFFGGG